MGGSISIDKDKVDAWTGSMRDAFTGGLSPITITWVVVGLALAIALVVVMWFAWSRTHAGQHRSV